MHPRTEGVNGLYDYCLLIFYFMQRKHDHILIPSVPISPLRIGVSLDPWMFPIKDRVTEVCGNVSQPLICISTEAFQSDANLQAMNSLPADTTTFVTIKWVPRSFVCGVLVWFFVFILACVIFLC